jgi:two-component system response regulator DevR
VLFGNNLYRNGGAVMPIKLLVACKDKNDASALGEQIASADARIASDFTDIGNALPCAVVIRPDVLLLEHSTGEEENSWLLVSGLNRVSPNTRLLLLCDVYTHLMIIGFIQRGVSGCLLRSSDPATLAKAISTVHRGDTWFGRTELLQAVKSQITPESAPTINPIEYQELLTAREREVLALIGNAMTNKEIAKQLKISDKTVKTHLHHIYVKLQRSGRYKAFLSDPATIHISQGIRTMAPGTEGTA